RPRLRLLITSRSGDSNWRSARVRTPVAVTSIVSAGMREARPPDGSRASHTAQALREERDIQRDAGAEGRRDRRLLDVPTLGRRGLRADDLVDRRLEVLLELLGGEARLADDEVHVRVLVNAELDLAALDVLD